MTRSRVLIVATIGTLVAYVVAAGIQPTAPGATATGKEIVDFFAKHSSAFRWSAWLGTVALIGFMTVIGLVTEELCRPQRTVFLVGGIVTVTATMLQLWFLAGLASHPNDVPFGTGRALLDVVGYYGPILTAATTVMLGAMLAASRPLRLPQWYVLLAAVVLGEQLVETVTIFGRDGFLEPGGAMNVRLGAGLFIVWFVATGLLFGFRANEPSDATVAAAG